MNNQSAHQSIIGSAATGGNALELFLPVITLEQLFDAARALVADFDRHEHDVQHLSIHDLGSGKCGGYVATFDYTETLQSESDFEYWFERADDFPRTAKGATVSEAIEKALTKTRAELVRLVESGVCRFCDEKPETETESLCGDCRARLSSMVTTGIF